MDKIYRRPTMVCGRTKKKRDENMRTRNVLINFRVTPNEKKLIDARIAASGKTRYEFLIQSCLYPAIFVRGNIRSFTEIRNRLDEIGSVIKDENLVCLDPEQLVGLKTIIDVISSYFKKVKNVRDNSS